MGFSGEKTAQKNEIFFVINLDSSLRSEFQIDIMGLSYSSRQDLYTHQFINPRVTEISQEFHYRLQANPGESHFKFPNGKESINPFPGLVSDKDMSQHVYITSISLLFLANEIKHDLQCVVENLFEVPAESNDDVKHTDESGRFVILCPSGYSGIVKGNDRILYKPRLQVDTMRTYAGIAEAIVQLTAPGAVSCTTYDLTHPLCYFIINNEHLLEPQQGDIEKLSENLYKFNEKFIARAREFFTNTIYCDMHATRFDNVKMSMKIPCEIKGNPNVTIIVQLNGLLVSAGELRLKNLENKI